MPTGRKIKCDGNGKGELSEAALHWGEGACYGCLECQRSAGDSDLYVIASVQIEEAQLGVAALELSGPKQWF